VSFENFDLSFPAAAAPRSADATPLMDFFKTQLATKFTKTHIRTYSIAAAAEQGRGEARTA